MEHRRALRAVSHSPGDYAMHPDGHWGSHHPTVLSGILTAVDFLCSPPNESGVDARFDRNLLQFGQAEPIAWRQIRRAIRRELRHADGSLAHAAGPSNKGQKVSGSRPGVSRVSMVLISSMSRSHPASRGIAAAAPFLFECLSIREGADFSGQGSPRGIQCLVFGSRGKAARLP
ncbi:MAG: hypothetical protein ACI9OJ_005555 [Myxococcota bacterium]|jgi:hypothetical protein